MLIRLFKTSELILPDLLRVLLELVAQIFKRRTQILNRWLELNSVSEHRDHRFTDVFKRDLSAIKERIRLRAFIQPQCCPYGGFPLDILILAEHSHKIDHDLEHMVRTDDIELLSFLQYDGFLNIQGLRVS